MKPMFNFSGLNDRGINNRISDKANTTHSVCLMDYVH